MTLELKILHLSETPEIVRQQMKGSARVVRHQHIQMVDHIRHAIGDSYVAHELLDDRHDALKERDTFDLLREIGHPVTHSEERLHVDTPSLAERELLEIVDMPTLPIIRMQSTTWARETVVEMCLLSARADLYELQWEAYR